MELCLETGCTSLNHVGEELCGDNVASTVKDNFTTLVLADGLGSGVKANILSTLTSKILCTMAANDIDIYECVETIIQTLPVCSERGVAYSTFSIIHVNTEGKGIMFEFDNPEAIYYHRGQCQNFERIELDVCGKKVYRTELNLEEDDIIIVMSAGSAVEMPWLSECKAMIHGYLCGQAGAACSGVRRRNGGGADSAERHKPPGHHVLPA